MKRREHGFVLDSWCRHFSVSWQCWQPLYAQTGEMLRVAFAADAGPSILEW